MKQFFLSCIAAFTIFSDMNAQVQQHIAGEYYLEGVMETASGFKFNEDSTFQFFFSYGALDRYGSGKWSFNNNRIVLNSRPYPGNDFKLMSAKKIDNDFITVKIEDANSDVYSFMHCLIGKIDGDTVIDANRDGLIMLPATIDTIFLLSEFCPERISSFAIDKMEHNYFIFHLESWMMEVFFKDFPLQFVSDHLEGKHPLLEDKLYKYVK